MSDSPIAAMFDRISPKYDQLNHLLSLNIDKVWRRKTAKIVACYHPKAILDLATGTADLAIQLAKRNPQAHIIGTDISENRQVLSHPQALGQCQSYIHDHGWRAVEYANTALAAEHVARLGDKSLAAIASAETAELYGLEVLEANINESSQNTTRFAVFSRAENRALGGKMGDHFMLVFTSRNEAGSLAAALAVLGKQYGFNMRTLRSRPVKELLWEYYFYLEAEGDIYSEKGQSLLRDMVPYCDRLKVVGTFERHVAI